MEFGEQRADMTQRAGDDIENRSPASIVRHFLREPRNAHSALHAHFARIGRISPAMSRSNVDLPAPLRPTTQMRSPRSIARSACSSNSGPPTE